MPTHNKIITIPFGQPFIEGLAAYLYEQFILGGHDLRRVAVVFGGRRPQLFLHQALAKRIKKTFYPPSYLTIDEWMATIARTDSGKDELTGELEHCYLIYQLSQRHCPHILEGRESFAAFLPWAREIAAFIEQLDLELVPARDLQALQEHARLGFDVPKDINRLLSSVLILRKAYHDYLKQKHTFSRGYSYFQAAQAIAQADLSAYDIIIFANFFYLHRSEMAVIKHVVDSGKGLLFMQGDQRRWPALKRIGDMVHTPILEGAEVAPSTFDARLYAATDMHAQAAIVRDIVKSIPDKNNTVVVCPDSGAMLPLVSALSAQLGEFNISMGYPLKRSALFSVLTLMVQLQNSGREDMYYARDYLRLLRHPLVKNLHMGLPEGTIRVLVHKIEEALTGTFASPLNGRIFVRLEDIESDEGLLAQTVRSLAAMGIDLHPTQLVEGLNAAHQLMVVSWQKPQCFKALAEVLSNWLSTMKTHSRLNTYPFNEAIVKRLEDLCQEIQEAAFADDLFDRTQMFRILLDYAASKLVAFSGSPLSGLQMLGLFETRSLDFKHVIVVDTNEGVLPNLNIYEPLIPREVMIQLNLDRLELEEEIQRYQFMRLICAAKNVHLIYLDKPDRERSRFIEELVWEKELTQNKVGVMPVEHAGFDLKPLREHRQIAKTPAMVEFLKTFTYSASSINTYIRNPYDFYLNYVLGLKPKDDLLDDPQSKHIGTFVHELLEESLKPFLGRKPIIDDAFMASFTRRFETRFHERFGQGMRPDAFLIKSVLQTRLKRFWEAQTIYCHEQVAELMYVEKQFRHEIILPGGIVPVTLKVDRVDKLLDGTIMIIDYKTGNSDALPKLELQEGEQLSRQEVRDKIKSVQLPLYVSYLDSAFGPTHAVNAALCHLRDGQWQRLLSGSQTKDRSELLKGLTQILDGIMREIWDLNTPFVNDPPG